MIWITRKPQNSLKCIFWWNSCLLNPLPAVELELVVLHIFCPDSFSRSLSVLCQCHLCHLGKWRGGKTIKYQTVGHFGYVPLKLYTILHFRKPSVNKSLPPRPPAAKIGRSQSLSWDTSPKLQPEKPHRKELVLPPRPNPGHRLYNKYTVRGCTHKTSRLVSTTA